jgi:hypothetical protein
MRMQWFSQLGKLIDIILGPGLRRTDMAMHGTHCALYLDQNLVRV